MTREARQRSALSFLGGIVTAIALIYTTMGGITAVIWTDVIQAVVLLAGAGIVFYALANQRSKRRPSDRNFDTGFCKHVEAEAQQHVDEIDEHPVFDEPVTRAAPDVRYAYRKHLTLTRDTEPVVGQKAAV